MTGRAATLTTQKELRALLPTWAVAMLAVVGARALQDYTSEPVVLFALALGCVALGSQLFGQEFGHRTLGLLLAQPLSRRVLFLIKAGVLAVLVLSLVAFSAALLSDVPRGKFKGGLELQWTLMISMAGFALAPCFTLVTRSGFAGLVFSVAVPGFIALISELAAIRWYGYDAAAQIDAIRGVGLWRGMLVVSTAAAIASWWLFMRIEDSDGRRRELQMPSWLTRSGTSAVGLSTRHPLLQLAIKELHLQQMAFVVAGLFCLAAGALLLSQDINAARPSTIMEAVVGMYVAVIALIVGSLASAEERQFGTLQSQMLLPVPARTQWLVKAGMALALVTVLGLGLPALMLWAGGARVPSWRITLRIPFMLVGLTSVAIYVSSLSSSGVRAIVGAMAAAFGGLMLVNWISSTFFYFLINWDRRLFDWYIHRLFLHNQWTLMVEATLVSALLLYLASQNHREVERSIRLTRQVAWIVGLAIILRSASLWI